MLLFYSVLDCSICSDLFLLPMPFTSATARQSDPKDDIAEPAIISHNVRITRPRDPINSGDILGMKVCQF